MSARTSSSMSSAMAGPPSSGEGRSPRIIFHGITPCLLCHSPSTSTAVDYCPTADAHGDYHRPQPCCRSAPHPAVTSTRHHEFTRRHPAKRHTAAAGVDESTVVGEDPRCILRPCIRRVHHRARLRPLRGRRDLDRCGGARGAHHLSADGPPLRRPLRLHGLLPAKHCAESCPCRPLMADASGSGGAWDAISPSVSSRSRSCCSYGSSSMRRRATLPRSASTAGHLKPHSLPIRL